MVVFAHESNQKLHVDIVEELSLLFEAWLGGKSKRFVLDTIRN